MGGVWKASCAILLKIGGGLLSGGTGRGGRGAEVTVKNETQGATGFAP